MSTEMNDQATQINPNADRFAPQIQADDRFPSAFDILRRFRETWGERQPDFTLRDPDRGQWFKSPPQGVNKK